jgi:uncharacterized membrane protein
VNHALVTRLPGLGLLLMVSTACAAADSSAEPPGVLDRVVDGVATGIEVGGIAVIVVGALIATAVFLRQLLRSGGGFTPAYRQYRGDLGRAIHLIGTVAVDPTFRSLGVLGLIVLIRTFLSFALEVEIQGRWPWQGRERSEEAPKD